MRILLFISVLILVSCNSKNEQDLNQIRDLLTFQELAWNNGNIEGFMSGYLRFDSLRFASGGNVSYGWQTTLERYKNGYPDKETMGVLTFSNIDIKLIPPDAALVFGKWELERETDHPWGLFTLVFNKTNDGWKIIHDHTSSANN